MRYLRQTAFDNIRALQGVFPWQPCSHQKLFQQPYPGAAQPTKSYHRALLEVGIVAVVLGAVFLLFWYSVLRAPPTMEFVESECAQVLTRYVSEDVAANALSDIAADGRLASCSVSGDATRSLGLGWTGSYDCLGTAVRYKAEENPNWLALAVETELPQLVYSNQTLIANLSGLPRFSYAVTVYNPAARASFEERLAKLRAQSCAV